MLIISVLIYIFLPLINFLLELPYINSSSQSPFFNYQMIIVIIIYIYSIFPLFLTSKKYYKIIGSFNYVTEFNILKKMTFVGFTFILILLAYILISNFILDINVITFLIFISFLFLINLTKLFNKS